MTLHVITGPPCVGKSWHVRANAQPGDIVIDLDRLALALTTEGTGHHDYEDHVRLVARKARHAAITAAMPMHRAGRPVWLIDAAPSPQSLRWYRQERATITDLTAPPEVLAERAAERPERNRELIKRIG